MYCDVSVFQQYNIILWFCMSSLLFQYAATGCNIVNYTIYVYIYILYPITLPHNRDYMTLFSIFQNCTCLNYFNFMQRDTFDVFQPENSQAYPVTGSVATAAAALLEGSIFPEAP